MYEPLSIMYEPLSIMYEPLSIKYEPLSIMYEPLSIILCCHSSLPLTFLGPLFLTIIIKIGVSFESQVSKHEY
jgi:hypothetical protein